MSEQPEGFDEESIWGHALRHKISMKDESVRQLLFALSEGDPSCLDQAQPETMNNFLRVLCGLLRKEAWMQAEVAATFAGICGMDASKLTAVVDKDWFVIAILRMLREPPEAEVFVQMVKTLRDVVAHATSKPEAVAWLCTQAVTELCLAMVTDPFNPLSLALIDLLMTAAMELGPVALRSFVKLATGHENARYFGETLIRIMNEAELDTDHPPPTGYKPAVMVLGFMHASSDSADFLYPADQRILLDVLLRHMGGIAHTAANAETWMAWIQAVSGIVLNSKQYRDGDLHKGKEIIDALRMLREELPEGAVPNYSAVCSMFSLSLEPCHPFAGINPGSVYVTHILPL